jgi:hypothetical protein
MPLVEARDGKEAVEIQSYRSSRVGTGIDGQGGFALCRWLRRLLSRGEIVWRKIVGTRSRMKRWVTAVKVVEVVGRMWIAAAGYAHEDTRPCAKARDRRALPMRPSKVMCSFARSDANGSQRNPVSADVDPG